MSNCDYPMSVFSDLFRCLSFLVITRVCVIVIASFFFLRLRSYFFLSWTHVCVFSSSSSSPRFFFTHSKTQNKLMKKKKGTNSSVEGSIPSIFFVQYDNILLRCLLSDNLLLEVNRVMSKTCFVQNQSSLLFFESSHNVRHRLVKHFLFFFLVSFLRLENKNQNTYSRNNLVSLLLSDCLQYRNLYAYVHTYVPLLPCLSTSVFTTLYEW